MSISKKTARILVPIVIVVAVGVMWLLTNLQESPAEVEPALSDTGVPLNITTVDLQTTLSHGLPIIIDFGADSCIPCKEMAPVLVSLNEEMQGKAVIQFADVWKHPEAAEGFPVQVIPTQVMINADGTPYVPSDEIVNSIPGFTMYADQTTEEHVFTVHQGGLTEEQMRAVLADMGVEA